MTKKRICLNVYNKNSKWLYDNEKNNCDYIIYKRVQMKEFNIKQKSENIYELKNIGKLANIAQTYLLHIINNYDNLYDIEIFLDAELLDLYSSNIWTQIKHANKYNFKSFGNLDKKLTWTNAEYEIEIAKKFKLTNQKFIHSPPKKSWFGWKVYKKLFPDKCEKIKCNFPTIIIGAYSLFSVKKKQILQHPLSKYKSLYALFDHTKFSSRELKEHYYLLEHTWKLLFTNF